MLRPRYMKQRLRLDQLISIQRRGVGTNEFNEPNAVWATVFTTRAAAYPAPGFERRISDQDIVTIPMAFEVRDNTETRTILPSDRVLWKDRAFNVVSPVEQPERGRNLRIMTAADRS